MKIVRHIINPRNKMPVEISESVALVSNSDQMLASKLGEKIDKHKTVFRFNLAVMDESLITDIGSKADYFLFSADICAPRQPFSKEEYIRFVKTCRHSKIICYPGKTKAVSKFNRRPFEMHITPIQVNKVFSRLLGLHDMLFSFQNHPRNGIKLLACLLDAGLKPNLYGFDTEDRGNNSHYFDDESQLEPPQSGTGHMPSIEYRLLQELSKHNLLSLH